MEFIDYTIKFYSNEIAKLGTLEYIGLGLLAFSLLGCFIFNCLISDAKELSKKYPQAQKDVEKHESNKHGFTSLMVIIFTIYILVSAIIVNFF